MIKAIISGKLRLSSPLLISSGEEIESEKDFVLDSSGNPFIPGTSLTGSLRNRVEKYFKENQLLKEVQLDQFWGTKKINSDKKDDQKNQSAIIIYNCYMDSLDKIHIPVRDGIKIDNRMGIAEDKKKYSYQILEKGNVFNFHAEIKIENDNYEIIVAYIMYLLSSGKFSIGAKTNNGFGKVKLEEVSYKKYDLSSTQIWHWLLKTDSGNTNNELLNREYKFSSKTFQISFKTTINSSLIIGDSHPTIKAQKFHLKSNNKPILSGSSLKGAIRARAEKILRTIGKNPNDENWKNFFGHEGNTEKTKDEKGFEKSIKQPALKSRLSVTESFFENTNEEVQTRIKIDRFTGGTIDGALFETMPLFQNKEGSASITFDINIRDFDYDKKEDKAAAGLLLLVLKDLWTGDLPIGGEKNVGRGRLRGVNATIQSPSPLSSLPEGEGDIVIELKSDEKGNPVTSQENWEKLEDFVNALNDLVGKS